MSASISPLPSFTPDLRERAWLSIPHPTVPLLATAHSKSVTVYSLATLNTHSTLTGGHTRSIRSVAWRPGLPPHKLSLITGSFDATTGLWRWDDDAEGQLEREITTDAEHFDGADKEWEFTLLLEGHDSEVKSAAFSPSGAYLATSSRDKSVWIWEDVGATEADDEWETVDVLSEHEGDVKAVAWCPDVPGRNTRRRFSPDVLASASYDNTIRIWREDSDREWTCVAVLEGHEGTVWGIQWESKPRPDGKFPRLLSHSADGTIRVWSLRAEDEEEDGQTSTGHGLGSIPNTMRRSLKEEWNCTDVLPGVHSSDVYSVCWSSNSGIVASTGSDGVVALYEESREPVSGSADGKPRPNGATTNGLSHNQESRWKVLTTISNSHGPYEVNHITWCRRYDAGSERRGEEEMLVTTGDDGLVRPWKVTITPA